MKHINDLTIKEWNLFIELMKGDEEEPDIYSIFELFGENVDKLSIKEYEKKWNEIKIMTLSTKGVKFKYNINGRIFKACLNVRNIKAGQFVDYQNYVKNGMKLEEILSVILIPMKKSIFGYKEQKYNDYDMLEVQEYLLNNFKIGEANELSAFFLKYCNLYLKMLDSSMKKRKMKQMKKKIKEHKKM